MARKIQDEVEGREGLLKVPVDALLKDSNVENGKLHAYIDELEYNIKNLKEDLKEKEYLLKQYERLEGPALKKLADTKTQFTPNVSHPDPNRHVYGCVKINKSLDVVLEITEYEEFKRLVEVSRKDEMVNDYKRMLKGVNEKERYHRKKLKDLMERCVKCNSFVTLPEIPDEDKLVPSTDDKILISAMQADALVPAIPVELINDIELSTKRSEYYSLMVRKIYEWTEKQRVDKEDI